MVLSVHGLVYAQRKLLLHLLRVTCGSPQMYSYCQIPHVLHLRSRSCKMSRLSWSPLEDAALRQGVSLYGEGSWQAIVKDVRLARRSNVAAKDRWRILKRQAGMSSFLLRLFVSFFCIISRSLMTMLSAPLLGSLAILKSKSPCSLNVVQAVYAQGYPKLCGSD